MVDTPDLTGPDRAQMSPDELLTEIRAELERLYAIQESTTDTVARDEALTRADQLQKIERTISRIASSSAPSVLDALRDKIHSYESRGVSSDAARAQDEQQITLFRGAIDYILGGEHKKVEVFKAPAAQNIPEAPSPSRSELGEHRIEEIKQRIQLEGLMFVHSSLPSRQWEEGIAHGAFFHQEKTFDGYASAYCPGKSALRNPKFLRESEMALFNEQGWGAPRPRDFSEYHSQDSPDSLMYRITPVEKAVYTKVQETETRPKKLFGFLPAGSEQLAVTKEKYVGTKHRQMGELTETQSQKHAYAVSFRRTVWTKWERSAAPNDIGRRGEESITMIVPEDIAREIAAIMREGDQSVIKLYDALRPSWMGGQETLVLRNPSFIRGAIEIK